MGDALEMYAMGVVPRSKPDGVHLAGHEGVADAVEVDGGVVGS
jgi:hypothetical protein